MRHQQELHEGLPEVIQLEVSVSATSIFKEQYVKLVLYLALHSVALRALLACDVSLASIERYGKEA